MKISQYPNHHYIPSLAWHDCPAKGSLRSLAIEEAAGLRQQLSNGQDTVSGFALAKSWVIRFAVLARIHCDPFKSATPGKSH